MALIKSLKESDFFQFVEDETQFQYLLQSLKEHLEQHKTLYFPTKSDFYREVLNENWRGQDQSLDFMSCVINPDDLVRGGLIDGLNKKKTLFDKRNLTFQIGGESMEWKDGNPHYLRHEVEVNQTKYLIADGEYHYEEGLTQYTQAVEFIIDDQLYLQNSKEKTYKVIWVEGMFWYVVMKKKHFEIFQKHRHEFSGCEIMEE
jgi:hypothetical protein